MYCREELEQAGQYEEDVESKGDESDADDESEMTEDEEIEEEQEELGKVSTDINLDKLLMSFCVGECKNDAKICLSR